MATAQGAVAQVGSWTTQAPLSTGRFGGGAAAINGWVYMVGGAVSACGRTGALEARDPTTGLWSFRPSMPTARAGFGAGVLGGRLFVVGGEANCNTVFATVESYDPAANAWSPGTPMPSPRRNHGVGVVNGTVYVVGGTTTGAPLNSVLAFDGTSWTPKAPMPTARYGLGVAVLNGVLYACGGEDGVSSATRATVEAYDPVSDTWQTRAPLPVPVGWTSATAAIGRVYVVGGSIPGTGVTGATQVYDPCTNTWEIASSMLTPRSDLATASAEGVVYAIGGTVGGPSYLTTVEAFTTPGPPGSWSPQPSLSTGRFGGGAAAINGWVYMVGGAVSACGRTGALEARDPTTGLWSFRPSMPTARAGFGVGVLGGRLFVVGGEANCNTVFATVESYDPAADAWSPGTPMPSPRRNHGVGVVNGTLYVVGGTTTGAPLNSVLAFDGTSWTPKAPMPTARYGLGVAVLNGVLYACGGEDGVSSATRATVEAYDPVSDTWQTRAPLPVPVGWTSATAAGGRVYVVGGSIPGTGVSGATQVYEPCTNTWDGANLMLTPRSDAAAVTSDSVVYAIGGTVGGTLNFQTTVEAFPAAHASVISYATGCAGAAGTMAIAIVQRPVLGTTYQIDVAHTDPLSLPWMITGLATVDIDMQGILNAGPGCRLAVGPDLLDLIAGTNSWSLTIPVATSLIGFTIHNQAVQLTFSGGNIVGMSFSNGVRATIGNS